jgi:hypothetical protein
MQNDPLTGSVTMGPNEKDDLFGFLRYHPLCRLSLRESQRQAKPCSSHRFRRPAISGPPPSGPPSGTRNVFSFRRRIVAFRSAKVASLPCDHHRLPASPHHAATFAERKATVPAASLPLGRERESSGRVDSAGHARRLARNFRGAKGDFQARCHRRI